MQRLYEQVQMFITIFIVASILFGVWSLQINSRMIAAHLPDHQIMPKYFAIQLVLILYKLQPALIHAFCYAIESMTEYRISSKIVENGKVCHISKPAQKWMNEPIHNYEIIFFFQQLLYNWLFYSKPHSYLTSLGEYTVYRPKQRSKINSQPIACEWFHTRKKNSHLSNFLSQIIIVSLFITIYTYVQVPLTMENT